MKAELMRVAAAAFVVGALAACGGGGGGLSVADLRESSGLAPPTETAAAQRARSASIVGRAGSLILSTIHGETSHADVPTFQLRSRCAGTRCRITEPTTGYAYDLRLEDFEFTAGDSDALGSRHGITLVLADGRQRDTDYTAFGAWMRHAGFAVQTERLVEQGITISGRYGLAGGDLTGTRPTGSATWLGLMVGTPATGNNRGDRLQGIAALNYDMSVGGGIDVGFSSIKNIDRGIAHATPTILFVDVPIASGGTFEAGLTGNRIQGGFYGPGHDEAVGIFEQANIVGAFGAKKQQ